MFGFFKKIKKKQYKAFAKNGVVTGIYNSKVQVEESLRKGYIASYIEVPEQERGIDGKFYDKGKAPKHPLFKRFKFQMIIFYYKMKEFLFPLLKFLKPTLFLFLLIVFIFICGLIYLYTPHLYSILKRDKYIFDFMSTVAPAIVGMFSILTAVFSIIYTKVSLQQQREQWLKGEYIKREAEILLEFRNAFEDTRESINWVLYTLFRPMRFGNFTPSQEQLTIKKEIYFQHFNKLNRINELYNKNQFIFKKYDIDEAMEYIIVLLNTISCLDGNDLVAIFYKKDETAEEYLINEYGKIVGSFLSLFDFNKFKHRKDVFEKLTKVTKDRDSEKQVELYIEECSSSFVKLMFRLDELTTYYDGRLPPKLKGRTMRFFQSAELTFKRKK